MERKRGFLYSSLFITLALALFSLAFFTDYLWKLRSCINYFQFDYYNWFTILMMVITCISLLVFVIGFPLSLIATGAGLVTLTLSKKKEKLALVARIATIASIVITVLYFLVMAGCESIYYLMGIVDLLVSNPGYYTITMVLPYVVCVLSLIAFIGVDLAALLPVVTFVLSIVGKKQKPVVEEPVEEANDAIEESPVAPIEDIKAQ